MEMTDATRNLMRLIGLMAIAVGAAWALQVVGLGGSTAIGLLMWVIAAATIAGAGAGLIYTMNLQPTETSSLRLRTR